MKRTLFQIPKMDCPSEERLIRMSLDGKLEGQSVLQFDLSKRELVVFHNGNEQHVLSLLEPLNFGAKILESGNAELPKELTPVLDEKKILTILLLINAVMFFVEMVSGIIASSTGLIADSLDMFADAAVYSLSLYAVGSGVAKERKAAQMSGYLQMLLAIGALFEVGRRFAVGSDPVSPLMIGIGLIALVANVSCMLLLAKHRHGGAHMKASWIFSTNDVIANMGVILAGLLVAVTNSRYPDLIIGSVIAIIVFRGSLKILRL